MKNLLLIAAALFVLTACNTVDGIGKDIKKAGESIEDAVLRDESDGRLWKHIAALPERCRTLLRVIAFADRPDYAELARALGMPQGSIGPTRGRGLAKLRIALAQDPKWEH